MFVHHCGVLVEGQSSLADVEHTRNPSKAVTPLKTPQVNDINIHADRQVTKDELCSMLSVSEGSDMTIIKHLDYSRVCAWWVLRMLTDMHKKTKKTTATTLLQCYDNKGE